MSFFSPFISVSLCYSISCVWYERESWPHYLIVEAKSTEIKKKKNREKKNVRISGKTFFYFFVHSFAGHMWNFSEWNYKFTRRQHTDEMKRNHTSMTTRKDVQMCERSHTHTHTRWQQLLLLSLLVMCGVVASRFLFVFLFTSASVHFADFYGLLFFQK